MRPVGFSTGALALADFRSALRMLDGKPVDAVELSALRQAELLPLLSAVPSLPLQRFSHVSIHLPSQFDPGWEAGIERHLHPVLERGWPLVLHPDAISDFGLWRELGAAVCIENMDKRKPLGRSVRELAPIFDRLPEATFCFDIGHARQYDPTMNEAWLLLRAFGPRLAQLHVSEVNTRSRHDVLSFTSILAFQSVAEMVPEDVPLIVESPVGEAMIEREISRVREALPLGFKPLPPPPCNWHDRSALAV